MGGWKQQSPIFLASGTAFMEDNFSTDREVGGWEAGRQEAELRL